MPRELWEARLHASRSRCTARRQVAGFRRLAGLLQVCVLWKLGDQRAPPTQPRSRPSRRSLAHACMARSRLQAPPAPPSCASACQMAPPTSAALWRLTRCRCGTPPPACAAPLAVLLARPPGSQTPACRRMGACAPASSVWHVAAMPCCCHATEAHDSPAGRPASVPRPVQAQSLPFAVSLRRARNACCVPAALPACLAGDA